MMTHSVPRPQIAFDKTSFAFHHGVSAESSGESTIVLIKRQLVGILCCVISFKVVQQGPQIAEGRILTVGVWIRFSDVQARFQIPSMLHKSTAELLRRKESLPHLVSFFFLFFGSCSSNPIATLWREHSRLQPLSLLSPCSVTTWFTRLYFLGDTAVFSARMTMPLFVEDFKSIAKSALPVTHWSAFVGVN